MKRVLKELQKDHLWVIFLLFFLWMCSVAMLAPHTTPIGIDFFASSVEAAPIRCSEFKNSMGQPPACVYGASTNVAWVAGAAFVSNAVLGLTLVPLFGSLSDSYGHKPFFLAGVDYRLRYFGARGGARSRQIGGAAAGARAACMHAVRAAQTRARGRISHVYIAAVRLR